jgi:GAF domain-containing protein
LHTPLGRHDARPVAGAFRSAAGAYTLADANLLSALASQTANALDNALLFEDATRRAEDATTLYELSQTVSSTLESEAIPERVADAVISLLGVDMFALLLHDEASDR